MEAWLIFAAGIRLTEDVQIAAQNLREPMNFQGTPGDVANL